MADRKISDLTALTTPASGDFLPIVDISEAAAASKNKRITIEELFRGVPLGTAAAPSIAIEGDEDTGVFSPGANQLAISTNGVARLTTSTTAVSSSLAIDHPLGAVGTPSITFTGDLNTGIYSPGADQVAISTNGTGRLFIDASGNVGVGVTPDVPLTVSNATVGLLATFNSNNANGGYITGKSSGTAIWDIGTAKQAFNTGTSTDVGINTRTGYLGLGTANNERLRITSAGLLGLGTSAPSAKLHISDLTASAVELLRLQVNLNSPSGNKSITWADSTNVVGRISLDYTSPTAKMRFGSLYNSGYQTSDLMTLTSTGLGIGTTSPLFPLDVNGTIYTRGRGSTFGVLFDDWRIYNSTSPGALVFDNGSERARIDSSGRLLVGTSTARSNFSIGGTTYAPQTQLEQGVIQASFVRAASPYVALAHSNTVTSGSNTGNLVFFGNDGTNFIATGSISSEVDGTPGANDMPGRLVFSTTADGASSPTERLRITSAGVLQVADAGNITVGTTTGTKIGTATTQKIGFYNATPVVQPTAVADATDAATVITQLNALLAKLRTLGIIAT
jgi:hypothetical protein